MKIIGPRKQIFKAVSLALNLRCKFLSQDIKTRWNQHIIYQKTIFLIKRE